ncbi:ABC transporter substrate-binding protein [Paenibacillus camelliae]|uniref:ABC transporter substrate-binding protein n=1 Tax=Paenibacillus camelliae TaxID=512410 RepID=UPI0020419CCD|nr:extracellular solute-binding protein [Paenibacillus camelliae]MCM3633433.1 extracellular solute-binding protein [Paenibacillus camelliae]
MKPKLLFAFNLLLGFMLLLSTYIYVSYAKSNESGEVHLQDEEWVTENAEQEVVLTIWSPKPILDYEIQSFQEANPNIRIQFTSLQGEPRLSERYLNALAEGTAPDIMLLPQAMLGSINSVDLIADLSQSHLPLDRYRKMMGEHLWDIHQSLDGEHTIALPFEAYPYVFYYRYDILEEKGYPADPDALAAYLREPKHLLQLVSDLQQDKQWLLQWENDLITLLNYGQFFFNRDIEYERDSDQYMQVIDTTLKLIDHAANISVWSTNGQEMLRNNELVAVYMQSFGENSIEEWAPDQAGKWRVTRLPLGIEAVDVNTSLSIAITEHSKHKAEAEKFLEHVMNTSTVFNWMETAPANEFLGGQDSGSLYLDILRGNRSSAVPTPLDSRLFEVWYSSVEQSRQSQYTTEDTLNAATQDVMDITSVAQEQLQLYIQRDLQ